MIHSLLEWLSTVPPLVAYGVVAVLIVIETALLPGAFVPTLTLLLSAGGMVRSGALQLWLLITVATAAATLGDYLGHLSGRFLGQRASGQLDRHIPASLREGVERLMTLYGGKALFFSRFIPVLRTVTPHLAGATGVSHASIVGWSAVGALVWSTAEVLAGYAAAAWVQDLRVQGVPVLALSILALAVTVVFLRRGRSPHPRPGVGDERRGPLSEDSGGRVPTSGRPWQVRRFHNCGG